MNQVVVDLFRINKIYNQLYHHQNNPELNILSTAVLPIARPAE